METPEFPLEIPDFWKIIENTLSIEPEGIRDIKVILTLLKYTTVQSITKFTKPKEIQHLELEFMSRRHDWKHVWKIFHLDPAWFIYYSISQSNFAKCVD